MTTDENKTHVNTGIRRILEIPLVYNTFQTLHGGNAKRELHFKKHFSDSSIKTVLDIGCGTGVLLDYLAEGVEYHGCDMEDSYIEFAREKYGNRGKFYQERVGEKIRKEWLGYFDRINLHGLLHHLPNEMVEEVLEVGKQYLKDGGKLVSIDATFYEGQNFFSKWIVSKDRGQNIKTPEAYLKVAGKFFDKIEGTLVKKHNRLNYSVYVMVMTK